MAGNTFGQLFKLTSFGESHGRALGGVIDGCPAGLELDMEKIQMDLNRRKPGQSAIVTQRKEPDTVEFYSGILKERPQAPRLVLQYITPIKNLRIIPISRIRIGHPMPIMSMTKNMVLEIIGVVVGAQHVKLPAG